jgi:hypothetical protein
MTGNKCRDCRGAAQFGAYSGFAPQPSGGLAHLFILDQHNLFDVFSNDRQVQLRAAPWRQGDRGGLEARELDETTRGDAVIQGRRAGGLDPR